MGDNVQVGLHIIIISKNRYGKYIICNRNFMDIFAFITFLSVVSLYPLALDFIWGINQDYLLITALFPIVSLHIFSAIYALITN